MFQKPSGSCLFGLVIGTVTGSLTSFVTAISLGSSFWFSLSGVFAGVLFFYLVWNFWLYRYEVRED